MRESSGVPKHAGRSGAKWRKCVEYFKKNSAWICHFCGGDIPRDVDPQKDRMSFTLHHIVPLKMLLLTGGDPYDYDNLTPAHRTCNSAHRDGDEIKQVIIVSRQW